MASRSEALVDSDPDTDGLDVLVVPYNRANEYHGLLASAIESEGAKIHAGEFPPIGTNSLAGLRGLFLPLVSQVYDRRRVDVVHLCWPSYLFITSDYSSFEPVNRLVSLLRGFVILANVLLARALGVSVVWEVHNKYNHERHHLRVNRLVNRLLARVVDALVVKCTSAKDIVADAFGVDPAKVRVIPHGNYVSTYPNEVSRSEARGRLGLADDEFVVLYFGQIREYKGVPALLDAYESVRTNGSRLLVVGSPINEKMRRVVYESAESDPDIDLVLEYVPNDEVQYYMNAADVVVLPYRDVLTSGSVLLAASFGRPVVAPEMGCVPDFLGDGGGFLYDPGEPDGLRTALADAMTAGGLHSRGQANFERARHLAWDDIGKDTYDLYESVCGERE